jgi:carbamoyl-phosphate synthase large subunit
MPKSIEMKTILVIGSGPAVIGQAGEFDYAGSQVCKVLKDEGYRVVVVNSNPATVMTDPRWADSVYLEPLTPDNLEKVIIKERPDALLANFGGQTALNLGSLLSREGILEKYGVKMLGAGEETIARAEDHRRFRETMLGAGLKVPTGGVAENVKDGVEIGFKLGFPVVIKAAYLLEGAGVWVAYNQEELVDYLEKGIKFSPIHQVLVEESLLGWKELEFEVIRDNEGHCEIITSLENIDSMGVHTGDSAVVVPAQSLTLKEYENLADLSRRAVQAIGVAGGATLQFAQNPANGEVFIIEVNPRFTRSSALAAKATGFQIAGITAKLALGFTLGEIVEGYSGQTGKFFEPALNHVAFKAPRFNFEKFPTADPVLGTSMKAVGETMAIGRNFKEAFQKGLRSLEIGRYGLGADGRDPDQEKLSDREIRQKIVNPNAERFFYLRYALKRGIGVQEVSRIDPWFLKQIAELVAFEKELTTYALYNLPREVWHKAKLWGFSDIQLAFLLRTTEDEVRKTRQKFEIRANYGRIAVRGGAGGPGKAYFYSTYDPLGEVDQVAGDQPKILIIGSGPNRIGRGGEADFCNVYASLAVGEKGYESIVVNNNPEAVSTGYEHSGKLYLEPITREDILNIIEREKPAGFILQFSATDLAGSLEQAGVKLLGTALDNINRIADPLQFKNLVAKLGLVQPGNSVTGDSKIPDDAIGVEVICVADGGEAVIAGMVEHIEEARIHTGDSAGAFPPYTLGNEAVARLKEKTCLLAMELRIIGLINVKFALKHDQIYLLEVNPWAGQEIPFISKALGIDWAGVAAQVMTGSSLKELGIGPEFKLKHTAIREAVFPFGRLPGVDPILGPEMRSTGAVMGLNRDFGLAFIKSQVAAGEQIPTGGTIFISIRDEDKRAFTSIAKQLVNLGFKIMATEETAAVLSKNNILCQPVFRLGEGRPNILDKIKNGEVQWIINTPSDRQSKQDEILIRSTAAGRAIPMTTTVAGAQAAVAGLEVYLRTDVGVKALQEYYKE